MLRDLSRHAKDHPLSLSGPNILTSNRLHLCVVVMYHVCCEYNMCKRYRDLPAVTRRDDLSGRNWSVLIVPVCCGSCRSVTNIGVTS